MPPLKIEIIDNQIENFYQINVFEFKKVNKWYQKTKFDWKLKYSEFLGKNYMCPEIHEGRITLDQYFERNVKIHLKDNFFQEIHRITITKNII